MDRADPYPLTAAGHRPPMSGSWAPAHPGRPGHDRDFEDLYRRRYLAMVRLATLVLGQVELAEEVVQEAFAAVYQRWDAIDEPTAYLRATVVNRCRDALRRRRLASREAAASTEAACDAPDLLRDAIAALPERQRTAVVLRFYEDLTIDEIAEVMATRPGTVKSWLHRALGRLRKVVEP